MRFCINNALFERFPNLRVGCILVTDVNNAAQQKKITDLLRTTENFVKQSGVDSVHIAAHPAINAWREAYESFGAKPKKYRSSVERILVRALDSDATLPMVNPLVDAYNAVSMRYLIPAGGWDLDKVAGDISLRFAGGDEEPVAVLGENEARSPKVGEVIYADEKSTLCRRWNWKESSRTQIDSDTRTVLIVFEALDGVEDQTLYAALAEYASLISDVSEKLVTQAVLSVDNPCVTLKKDSAYVSLEPVSAASLETLPLELVAAPHYETETGSREFHDRIKKVEALESSAIDPWPPVRTIDTTCQQLVNLFVENDVRIYGVAGRLMQIRHHGKSIFARLQDYTGSIQIYIKKDALGEESFNFFHDYIDVGDIFWCRGTLFKTKTGEITLAVSEYQLMSKCLRPLPDKFHGLADREIRYRQRYLDLMMNPEVRERFKKRTRIINLLRQQLIGNDFLEVETPMLHPIPGGAAARPFVTHHNTLDMELFLRIAPELYLKRLVVGGFERVFEIGRTFRNEGVSTRHNPEFTMLEFYLAYHDYRYMMDFIESMIKHIVLDICESDHVVYGEKTIDFSRLFDRMSPYKALLQYTSLDEAALSAERIDETCAQYKIAYEDKSYAHKVYELFEEAASSEIMHPTYIVDFPIEVSPLAKRDKNDPSIAARFELYCVGMEISNGFNELNNPFDQADRFREQAEARVAGEEEAMYYDADYVHALEYALPPTVGAGIGIDRLVMLLTNTESIREVILFPTLRKKS